MPKSIQHIKKPVLKIVSNKFSISLEEKRKKKKQIVTLHQFISIKHISSIYSELWYDRIH